MANSIEIVVCMGSSCFSRGNNALLERVLAFVKDNNLQDRVIMSGSRCEGQCCQGPNVRINGTLYGDMKAEKVIAIIRQQLH